MEYVKFCDICCLEYDEDCVIPKVLDCGHSFCSDCIEKLIESNPYCPKCREELDEEGDASDLPTNYSLIDALEALKSSTFADSLELMKNKLEAKRELLTRKKSQISSNLNLINDGLAQLQKLTLYENGIQNDKNAKRVFDKVKKNCSKMKNLDLLDLKMLRDSVNINFNNYKDFTEYLMKIYDRLKKNEKIYAVKNIGDVVKYGKVSFQDNMILFHALTVEEKPENSTLIWFDELKQCVSDKNFFTFLKLTCNKNGVQQLVTIHMLDSQLASLFITLCTGECGPSYKGCYYKDNDEKTKDFCGILRTEDFIWEELQNNGRIDYISKVTNNNKINKDRAVVYLGNKGEIFSFHKLLTNVSWQNIVGTVKYPENISDYISFEDVTKLKIEDSGILFKL